MKKVEKTVSVDVIVPYWRNPRMNHEAVAHVAQSIKDYGFNQPIIIDKNNTIIAGHTRFSALKVLGATEVDVIEVDMTEQEAREYRIVDNRTSDIATWDTDKLMAEINTLDDKFREVYFPEIVINSNTFDDKISGFSEVEVKKENEQTQVLCPYCDFKFIVNENN